MEIQQKGADTPFPGTVTIFHEQRLPEAAQPVGYAALIDAYDLLVPLPRRLSAISAKHRMLERDGWRVYSPRYAPAPTLEGHLVFALKYEGLDLAVLCRLFRACGPEAIAAIVRASPTGSYARQLWFLYEWLLGERLDLADATSGGYVRVVDPEQQYAVPGTLSARHRVRDNLPGDRAFCPLIFRTPTLDAFLARQLDAEAKAAVAAIPRSVLARTAAFLLLKDSRSSYAIEGESAPQDRIQRWGRAIGQAGRNPIDLDELLRLQRIVIGDARFVHIGLREEGGFVGEHDHDTRTPLPDHISARAQDLADLVAGMARFDRGAAQELDPVLAAAALAFGFVYAHPFEDGNGRLHRYLIHHVLAERGYSPPGVVFPVSAAILDRIDDYRAVLESYSTRLLPVIRWEPTGRGNVRVLNDTGDFYRYFDATPHAEFLFACVERTILEDLPREAEFLRRYDLFRARVSGLIDMPDRQIDLLFRFLQQNRGQLSKRAREQEFASLTPAEITAVEAIFSEFQAG